MSPPPKRLPETGTSPIFGPSGDVPVGYADAVSLPDGHPSSGAGARPDNRLAMMDQAFYDAHRAAGQKEVMQTIWVYDRAVDLDELRRVNRTMARGLLGRRIEHSSLPFGRYRWVADPGPPPDIDIEETPRSRAEIGDWADERSQLPLDPERGPCWHIGVLPLTDGSTAVSLVISHYIADGIGGTLATIEAMLGITRDLGYPPPRSRTRLRALAQDAGQAARDVPAAVRALVVALKEARRHRREGSGSAPSSPVAPHGTDGDDPIVLPNATAYIDLAEWDDRAKALGGTGNVLAVALTARLGERLGFRHEDDGRVAVQLLVNDRTEADTRAVAVSFARVHVDPAQATTDLGDTRTRIRQALKTLRETPDISALLAPMAPFTPKRTWTRLVDQALYDPDRPVVCSHLGSVGPTISHIDGTRCEYGFARGNSQHLTRQLLERKGGHLQMLFVDPGLETMCIHVLGYQPGAVTTKPALRELVADTLVEFGLTGKID